MKLAYICYTLSLFIMTGISAEKVSINEQGGELGYLKMGKGTRTLILVPGIGDLKENYLDLANEMAKDATIYALDLRGLGESSIKFESFGADETGSDIEFFIKHFDLTNVTIVSNSMSAASAIYAATRLPERVEAIVLTGPFIRNKEMGFFLKSAIGAMFSGPWGPAMFKSFYKGLYPVNQPKDLEEHSDRIKINLNEDGRMSAVRSMFYAGKPESEKSISKLKTKVAVIMGDKDPDFDDPLQEAKEIAALTKGEYRMFENCGHYPYKEDPLLLKKIIIELWQKK